MSPKKSSKKRSAKDLDSPQSPSSIKPNKITTRSRILTKDNMDQIMQMLSEINNKIETQSNEFKAATNDLKTQIATSHDNLKGEMTTLVENMKTEFKEEIATLNTKIDSTTSAFNKKVDVINDTVSQLDSRMNYVEKDHERLSHLNELKLVGIPIAENENLPDIFIKLSNIIGFDASNVSSIPIMSRGITRNRATNEISLTPTIIMKFVAVHIKEAFYSLYLRLLPKHKISAKDLGFTSEARIVICENLSRLNHEIFVSAYGMKRENKLAQVYTSNGIVNVKLQKGGTSHVIRHKHQLDMLVHLNAPTPAQGDLISRVGPNATQQLNNTEPPTNNEANLNTHTTVAPTPSGQQQTPMESS